MYNPLDFFIIDDSGSMNQPLNITTAIINGAEVEYDGVSEECGQKDIEFYVGALGWQYMGKGATHTFNRVVTENPRELHFWKRKTK